MNEDTLARLAAAGLDKCLLKMTGISPGAWQLAGARVFTGTVRDAMRRQNAGAAPAAALRIKIKGSPPFTTALFFNPEDTRHISGCFADGGFCVPPGEDEPEVTLIEIGNIILNALANSLLRAVGKTAVPSVPAYFKGDSGAVEKWLGAGPSVFSVVSVKFTMRRDGRTAAAEALAFLPPALAAGTAAD